MPFRASAFIAFVLFACMPRGAWRPPLDESPSLRPWELSDIGMVRQPLHATMSPEGARIAYILGDSLLVADADGEQQRTMATPVAGGMAGWAIYPVAPLQWSPDGNQLAYGLIHATPNGGSTHRLHIWNRRTGVSALAYPSDTLVATQLWEHRNSRARPRFSPDGRRLVLVSRQRGREEAASLYMVDLTTMKETRLRTGGRTIDAAFSPSGRHIAVAVQTLQPAGSLVSLVSTDSLVPDSERIIAVDTGTSIVRSIAWSPDGRRILADRLDDRARRSIPAQVMTLDSDLRRLVARDTLPAAAYVGFTSTANVLGVQSSGMVQQLMLVNPETRAVTPLTAPSVSISDVAIVAASDSTTRIAFAAENGHTPREYHTAVVDGSVLTSRRQATEANSWADEVMIGRSQVFRWRGFAGDSLNALLFLPPQPVRRLPGGVSGPPPLVVIPYGRYVNRFPQAEWALEGGIQWLASLGFAVVLPNTRGLDSDRLQENGYGRIQLEDTRELITALGVLGLVDARRVAVVGHSHGGALAFYYGTHSRQFCASVAINGWGDWATQSAAGGESDLYTRAIGGPPSVAPDAYRDQPFNHVSTAVDFWVIVTGGKDNVVPASQGLRMAEALKSAGKDVQYLTFPDEGHVIQTPSNINRMWTSIASTLQRRCRSG